MPKDQRHAKQPPDDQADQVVEPTPSPGPADDPTAELREQVLRIKADFDNFRKRAEEERARYISVARTDVVLSLLPVIDNFDRAFSDVPEDVAKSNWYQGIAAIKQQFETVLRELNIERIESVGQPFDPEVHEAVSHEPNDQYDKDVVAEEFEAGYRLGDDVIRHARVKVSSGPDTNQAKEEKE